MSREKVDKDPRDSRRVRNLTEIVEIAINQGIDAWVDELMFFIIMVADKILNTPKNPEDVDAQLNLLVNMKNYITQHNNEYSDMLLNIILNKIESLENFTSEVKLSYIHNLTVILKTHEREKIDISGFFQRAIKALIENHKNFFDDSFFYDLENLYLSVEKSEDGYWRDRLYQTVNALLFLFSVTSNRRFCDILIKFLYMEVHMRVVDFVDNDIRILSKEMGSFPVTLRGIPYVLLNFPATRQGLLEVVLLLAKYFEIDGINMLDHVESQESLGIQHLFIQEEIYVRSYLENARPGAIKEIKEKFGIEYFCRYDKDVLLDMLTDIQKYSKVVLHYTSYSDKAFSYLADEERKMLKDAYFQFKSVGVRLVFVESENKLDFWEKVGNAQKAIAQKADGLFIRAHSSRDSVYFSKPIVKEDDEYIEEVDDGYLRKEELVSYFEPLPQYFNPSSFLVFNACGVGRKNGLADEATKVFDTVYSGKGFIGTLDTMQIESSGSSIKPILAFMENSKRFQPPVVYKKRK